MFQGGGFVSQEVISPERQISILQCDSFIGAGLGFIVGPAVVFIVYLMYQKINVTALSAEENLKNDTPTSNQYTR